MNDIGSNLLLFYMHVLGYHPDMVEIDPQGRLFSSKDPSRPYKKLV